MKTRLFPKIGKNVSEIGIGCWQLGGDFGPMAEAQAQDILQETQKQGITFLDTADVYGDGRSETLIGAFIPTQHPTPFVTTKVGRSSVLYPDGYSFENIRNSLIGSAERLGVDTIDLVQLHCVPLPKLENGEVFAAMDQLKKEGLIANWGASVETLEEAHFCLKQPNLASLQIIFNVFRQDAAWDLFPAAQEAGVGIIVRLPLASGLLAGKYTADTIFHETDHRNYNRDGAAFSLGETFSGFEFSKGLELIEQLRAFVPDGYSLADMCMRWLLDWPAVTTIIAGCSRPDQVVRNARVSALSPLSDDLHAKLKDFYMTEVRNHIRCDI